jgi:hypothetical protein
MKSMWNSTDFYAMLHRNTTLNDYDVHVMKSLALTLRRFRLGKLAHIVTDDGQTIYEKAQATMLLPAPNKMKVIK